MIFKQDVYTYGFYALSALIFSNVRNYIQYDVFATKSIGYFLGSWVIHYVAIFFLCAGTFCVYGFIRKRTTFESEESKEVDFEDLLLIVFSSVFTASIAVFAISVGAFEGLSVDY